MPDLIDTCRIMGIQVSTVLVVAAHLALWPVDLRHSKKPEK